MLSTFVFATTWILITARTINTNVNQESCAMHPWRRVECGWPGITKAKCEAQGCCFDPTHKYSLWCFQKDQRAEENKNLTKLETTGTFVRSCSFESTKRIDCGWPGIHKDVCELRGCCYDDKENNKYWCFYPESRFTIPQIEDVMRCVSNCASYTWAKTVELGTTCFADVDCWWRTDGIIAASCLEMCKKNTSASGSLIRNVSSCLKGFGIEDVLAILDCEYDMECWERNFGQSSRRCLTGLLSSEPKSVQKQEIAYHPDKAIQEPRNPKTIPKEAGIPDDYVPPTAEADTNRTHVDVEKSVGSRTVKLTDQDKEA